jgi:hypothetical protein
MELKVQSKRKGGTKLDSKRAKGVVHVAEANNLKN